MKRLLLALLLLVSAGFSVTLAKLTGFNDGLATMIATDKADYPPGSAVIITGSGFQPGETVDLQVTHTDGDDGDNDTSGAHAPWQTIADENGNISTTWQVPFDEDELGATLLLTAVGESSGPDSIAQITFTDAAAVGTFTTAFSPTSTPTGGTVTVKLVVNNVNTGNSSTTDDLHAIQVDVPAGATVTWGAVNAYATAGTGSPLAWDQTAYVVNATTVGFTRNSSAATKVPAGGRVEVTVTIALNNTACFGVRAYGNNGYGQGFSGNANTTACLTVINPNVAPSFTACPGNRVVSTDVGQCYATVSYSATASGVPNTIAYSFTFSGATTGSGSGTGSGAHFNKGVTTVTITASNGVAPNATCTFTVTVNDTELPTITAPGPVTVNTDAGLCSAAKANVSLGSAIANDNCPGWTVSNDAPATFPKGATVVTWTVTAAGGNTATSQQTVTVVDNENPTITCPSDITVSNTQGQCGAVVSFSATPHDNCPGVSVSYSQNPGTSFPVGTTTVTATATDAAGHTASCSFKVTVNDTEKPVITCPADITVANDAGVCGAVVSFAATATDNCGSATVTYSKNPGTLFAVGTTAVTATATDAVGNVATCTFNVTVTDSENPTIACPADITAANDEGKCGAKVSYVATASDNCPNVSVSYSIAPGSFFPVGTTAVTATATDAAGNVATCMFNVIVNDTEKPTISTPAPVLINTDLDSCSTAAANVLLGTPVTGDNCGVASVSNDAPAIYLKGVTTVCWTVTDIHGNKAKAFQTVTVQDKQAPTIAAPANITVSTDPNSCSATVLSLGTPVTGDNCGVASVINDHPSASYPKGTTIVCWTVTDTSGNTAKAFQKVTVEDHQNPSITCPANITVNNDPGLCTAKVNFTLGFSDNCPGASLITSAASGSSFPVGTTTVNATVTDASGNTAACSFTVTVVDAEAPHVITKNITVNITNGNSVSISPADVNNGTWDNCGTANLSLSKDTFSCADIGTRTVTLTANDGHGNTSSATATVTVIGEVIDPSNTSTVYTGAQTFWTTTSTSSTASLALSATIKAVCGDVTKAQVRFLISNNAGSSYTPVTQWLNVGPVNNSTDPGLGTASATCQYDIGNNNAVTLFVKVEIGGYFVATPACHTIWPICVAKNGTGRIVGAASLKNTTSPNATGILATSGSTTLNGCVSTSVGVWYNKSGTNPQGDVSGTIEAGGRTYTFKSTAISTFAVKGTTASFASKTVLIDVTNPGAPINLDSGNLMQIDISTGTSGQTMAISIQRSSGLGGGLWYSSGWDGTKTVQKAEATGPIAVTP